MKGIRKYTAGVVVGVALAVPAVVQAQTVTPSFTVPWADGVTVVIGLVGGAIAAGFIVWASRRGLDSAMVMMRKFFK